MSDTAETRQGFEIRRRFYPLVTVAEWRNGDFILARDLTHRDAADLFSGKADYLTVQMALVAVAISRARAELDPAEVVTFVRDLKPDQITEVGFASLDDEDDEPEEGDGGPPAGNGRVQESGSAESSGTATATGEAPTPTATGAPSGPAGSLTGSPESRPA